MFLDLFIYFFFVLCNMSEKRKWLTLVFLLQKNAFPLYLYPFIVFHISVWSERFLDKFALLELRISPIRYFVFHNCIMYPKSLCHFDPLLSMQIKYITKQMNSIELLKKHFPNFITGEICSSSWAALYKKPSELCTLLSNCVST